MSANIFPLKTIEIMQKSNFEASKIPIASSPTPFRRVNSLKLNFSRDRNHHHRQNNNDVVDIELKRGNSFMERGERRTRHGVQPSRPQDFNNTFKQTTSDSKSSSRSSKGPTTPQSPGRIRSLSLSLSNTRLNSPRSPSTVTTSSPKTPPTTPNGLNLIDGDGGNLDWDSASITSLNSVTSVGSCDHASIARNGTTFSGRSMKYVFHCNQHSGATGDDYLTPTQRVHRQVKRLKVLLHQAKKDLEDKDSDILKLTKEVVELRLYKAALNSPEDKSNSSDAITVKENNTDEDITPDMIDNCSLLQNNMSDMTSSYTDSGHYDDMTSSSKDSSVNLCDERSPMKSKSVDNASPIKPNTSPTNQFCNNVEHEKLIEEYEKRLQELVKTHEENSCQLKQKHNDKIEELLQRITEINTRYWQLVPELDLAKEKIKELELQLEEACKKLEQQEKAQKQTYLEMYNKGQEAARVENENRVMDIVQHCPSRISVPELLQELQVTKNELESVKDLEYASSSNSLHPLLSAKEALSLWVLGARKAMYRQLMEAKNKSKIDPEITLQFLKSAIYYFLTDKENSQGHLKAIQSILGFTSNEISNIDKARLL